MTWHFTITRAKPATPVYSHLRRPNHRSVDKGRERQKKFEIPTLLYCGKSKNVDSQTRCGLGKFK